MNIFNDLNAYVMLPRESATLSHQYSGAVEVTILPHSVGLSLGAVKAAMANLKRYAPSIIYFIIPLHQYCSYFTYAAVDSTTSPTTIGAADALGPFLTRD